MAWQAFGNTYFGGLSEMLLNPSGGESGKPNRPDAPKNNYAGMIIALVIFAVLALFNLFGGR